MKNVSIICCGVVCATGVALFGKAMFELGKISGMVDLTKGLMDSIDSFVEHVKKEDA